MALDSPAPLQLQPLLAGIDALTAQRPVAARIVAVADAADTSAKDLAAILVADIALAGRVMKLANSAYFGMRGRVGSLQLAVTVVGFTTVRTMATVALTDLDDESRLPEDFWTVGTQLAVAAAQLAPAFGIRSADGLCLGVLAQLGSALMYQHDPAGYGELLAAEPTFAGRRREETRRYGLAAVELTAVALRTWGFPESMTHALERIDDRTSVTGGLLRACYEVVTRLASPDSRPTPIGTLTHGRVLDDDLAPVLYEARNQAEDLRLLLTVD